VPGLILVPSFPVGLPPIEVDVTRSLTDDLSFEVAEHAVQGADSVADEVLRRARQVSYDVLFSDAPPGLVPAGRGRAEALVARLREVAERKFLIVAVTPDDAVTNLVIRGLRTARDRATGKARPVSLSLQRVRVVSLELFAAVVDSDLSALGALGSIDKGLQP
jgi:hypothetical protein